MKYIGAHTSITGSLATAPEEAHRIGAKSFAMFLGSPSRWKTAFPKPEQIDRFRKVCEEYGYGSHLILPHSNFLVNLGSPDAQKLHMSRTSFEEEMHKCEALGLTRLNFHPGSHLNQLTVDECLDRIAESLNIILEKTTGVMAVLENTAGQGSNLGHTFEQLAHIMDRVEDKSRVGVCVDTCHAYSAGYDLGTPEGYEATWKAFDEIIGLNKLVGMHLNDDLRAMGSRIDRHASIGAGTLGREFFTRLVNDPRFDNIPLILETPDEALWPEEIAWLYSQIHEK